MSQGWTDIYILTLQTKQLQETTHMIAEGWHTSGLKVINCTGIQCISVLPTQPKIMTQHDTITTGSSYGNW